MLNGLLGSEFAWIPAGMLATDMNGNVRLFSYNADKTTPGFEKLDVRPREDRRLSL